MSFVLAQNAELEMCLEPALINRHGLITGATGTGKTISLQVLAEGLSNMGVPVFLADVKGDLSGLAQQGTISDKLTQFLATRNMPTPTPQTFPVTFWDVLGHSGHPVRATISDMGPLMLARLLNLNEVQTGVLQLVFKIADDQGLLLLDLKDLRAMVQHVGENAAEYKNNYGNVSSASVGAILRGLLTLDVEGGTQFFGEPMLNIDDLMQTLDGKGVINILAAEKLIESPRIYSVFLLWLLSELFEQLPEVGDLPKPKFVFFFDEAHLLFNDAPPVLLEKIEQLVRLIRSKGVGVYFVSQNPLDIPDKVLAQLGNRVQHALRAFTPRDQKAVKVAAETMRANPKINAEAAITELAVGEALISLLDAHGTPSIMQRAYVRAPASKIGPITPDQRQAIMQASLVAGQYETTLDRESAFECLKGKVMSTQPAAGNAGTSQNSWSLGGMVGGLLQSAMGGGSASGARSSRQGVGEAMVKSVVRTVGSEVGRQLIRGLMGSLRK